MELTPVQSLFLSQKFSDVTFNVDNKQIPAHKALLAASCPYFEIMLFRATNESRMTIIELKNVSYKVFVEVLRAIYYQKVDINGWSAEEVTTFIEIADEYQFSRPGPFVAKTLSEDEITADTVDDIHGVGKRLNCGPLIAMCEEIAQRNLTFLLSNETAFDKLSMDLIGHLMDKKVFDPIDEKLFYSISNWRNTGSVTEKKTLLSKLNWKHLLREYVEPLIQTLLQRGDSGLKVKNWCKSVKALAFNLKRVAAVYNSLDNNFMEASVLQSFMTEDCQVLDSSSFLTSRLMIHFRDPICDIVRITFSFGPPAQVIKNSAAFLSVTVFSTNGVLHGKRENRGLFSPPSYEFKLPKKADILVIRISFDNYHHGYNSNIYGDFGKVQNFEFHHI